MYSRVFFLIRGVSWSISINRCNKDHIQLKQP